MFVKRIHVVLLILVRSREQLAGRVLTPSIIVFEVKELLHLFFVFGLRQFRIFLFKLFFIGIFTEPMCLRQRLPALNVKRHARNTLVELSDFLLYLDLEGTCRVVHIRDALEL